MFRDTYKVPKAGTSNMTQDELEARAKLLKDFERTAAARLKETNDALMEVMRKRIAEQDRRWNFFSF